MRQSTARRRLAPALAAATLLATATTAAAASAAQGLTAPVGSTKGSLLPYLEQENVTARFIALQPASR